MENAKVIRVEMHRTSYCIDLASNLAVIRKGIARTLIMKADTVTFIPCLLILKPQLAIAIGAVSMTRSSMHFYSNNLGNIGFMNVQHLSILYPGTG